MDACAGIILYAGLFRGTLDAGPFPDTLKRSYPGCRGIGARILSDPIDPSVDPLAPGNASMLAAGSLTGTGMPLGSSDEVMTKSPLNGTLPYAYRGGG